MVDHCSSSFTKPYTLFLSFIGLSSMEVAWTQGIHLCECDIAITKDEVLILAHDENFSRLALHPSNVTSTKKVQDLTLKEVIRRLDWGTCSTSHRVEAR